MKKIGILALGIVICLTACGDSSATRFESSSITVEEVLANGITESEMEAASQGSTNSSATEDTSAASSSNSAIDDISVDSSTISATEDTSASASESASSDAQTADASSAISGAEGIDVDLTVLSSTMVYSQVYDMVYFPENYVGQTVKMEGIYTHYHDDTTGKDYYACFIQDATACCAQGIEFELTDDYVYPDDYPEEGGYVCVSGTFDIYEEDGFTYCTLRNSTLCE
ncbi:MAG: hypothetical protein IJV29_09215 [Butyrivibrio sp.]|nr:hypothetical protein [Butyrivibrio sp.]